VDFDTAKDCNRYGVSKSSTLNICLTENISKSALAAGKSSEAGPLRIR
jgi:hypothetical protein